MGDITTTIWTSIGWRKALDVMDTCIQCVGESYGTPTRRICSSSPVPAISGKTYSSVTGV